MAVLGRRKVLVTGGCGTIGRALVSAFTEADADVTILDRPEATPPPGHGWIGCDLNDLKGTAAAVEAVVAETGGFDVLVNNAALILNRSHEDFTFEEYEEQIRVNSTAGFVLARAVSPVMRSKGRGRIINLTSLTLNGEWDGFTPYVASKGAVLGLTRALSRELGPYGITVNAIAPGAVVSEAEARVFAEKLHEYNEFVLKRQAIKRRITAEDIANLAVFLASDGAAMISGQNIGVDGGW